MAASRRYPRRVRDPEDDPAETLHHEGTAPLDLPPSPRRGSLVPRWLAWLVLVALLAAAATGVWQLLTAPVR